MAIKKLILAALFVVGIILATNICASFIAGIIGVGCLGLIAILGNIWEKDILRG